MTRMKSALTAATLAAGLSFGAYAGDVGVTPEQIAAAKTPAEHEAIAAAFDQEAAQLEAKAKEHERMALAYTSAGSKKGAQGAAMRAHCTKLVEQYSAAAKENRELAKAHRAMEHSQ